MASSEFDSILRLCTDLGVPIAPNKTIFPTTCLEYLGIIIDSLKFEARLSDSRVTEIKELLAIWINKRHGSKRSLLSLVGKLMYCCQVVIHGRPFLRRLINKSHSVSYLHYNVHLSASDRQDIHWWNDLLQQWNGVSLFRFLKWESLPDFEISSDAAKSKGFGIIYGSSWCFGLWLTKMGVKVSIAALELIPVVVAAHLWGDSWERKRIVFNVDNQSVVDAINSGLPKDNHLSFFIRELAKLSVLHSFSYKASHLRGINNKPADALSRGKISLFRTLCPDSKASPCQVLSSLLNNLVFHSQTVT